MALGWPGLCDLMCRTYEVPEVARPQSKQLGLWCLMMFGDASRAENKGNSIVTPSPIVANNGSECKNAQVFFSLGDVWSSAALADQRPAARVHHSFKSEPRMISTSGVEPRRKYKMDFTIQDELNLREAPKDTGNAYFMKGFTSHLGIKRYSYIFCYIHAYISLLSQWESCVRLRPLESWSRSFSFLPQLGQWLKYLDLKCSQFLKGSVCLADWNIVQPYFSSFAHVSISQVILFLFHHSERYVYPLVN